MYLALAAYLSMHTPLPYKERNPQHILSRYHIGSGMSSTFSDVCMCTMRMPKSGLSVSSVRESRVSPTLHIYS